MSSEYVPQHGDVVLDQQGSIYSRRGDGETGHWLDGGFAPYVNWVGNGDIDFPLSIADQDAIYEPLILLVRFVDAYPGQPIVEIADGPTRTLLGDIETEAAS